MNKEVLDEREFELINIIGPKIGLNQRDLSKKMNVSLGMVNMLIRRLISKGFIRIKQLNKKKVEYILTPTGFTEKMRKSVRYTLKTLNSIGMIKARMKVVLSELIQKGERNFYVFGESDFSFLVDMVLKEASKEDYFIRHLAELPDEDLKGVLLICREMDSLQKEKLSRFTNINLVEELAKDYDLLKGIS